METTLKFILCKEYDFEGNHGISCKALETNSNTIVSVQVERVLDEFKIGDDLLCTCEPNGKYLKYVAIA